MARLMNRVPQHPVQAFAAALAAVGVLSIMDAVMKALVIAIGIYVVSIWRSLVTLGIAATLYLPTRRTWPTGQTLRIHRTGSARAGHRADLHRTADRIGARGTDAPRADRVSLDPRFDRRLRGGRGHRLWPGEGAARSGGPARQRRNPRFGAVLCGQHRPDASSGACRQAARNHLLPVADRDDLVAGGGPAHRPPRLAGRTLDLDHRRRADVDGRRHALCVGLCARPGELPRGDRI